MHHCVYDYVKRCVEGSFRFFSIRKSGKRVATMHLEYSEGYGQWRIAAMKGPHNAEVTVEVFDVSLQIQYYYNDYRAQFSRESSVVALFR